MKKITLLFAVLFFFSSVTVLKGQCYGSVKLDVAVSAGVVNNAGNTTFTITTSHCNELIMISYNGWNGPGQGPVTVNGNPATFISDAITGNSGCADVYAYSAATAGSYSISCSPSGYNSGYYTNFAAGFYVSGSGNPITIGSLTATTNTIACTTGGSITGNITTSIPNTMIYCSCEINEGEPTSYPISWTNATYLGNEHTEDGIDAGHADTAMATPGTYTITATNSSPANNGCGGLTLVLVDIPPPLCGGVGGLSVSSSKVNASCLNNNGGSISFSVSGGTPGYTYTWSPNVSTSATATGLSAGTYTAVINDAACHDTAITTVLTGNTLGLTATVLSNEPCNGNHLGSITTSISGGTSPYTFSWSPAGGSSATATGLSVGTFTVVAIDKNGCTNTTTATITQPTAVGVTASGTGVTCYGGNNGTATASASGGVGTYTYSWSPGGGSTQKVSGLSAGFYTVTVNDKNGCSHTTSIALTQPTVITGVIANTNEICNGGNNAKATASASGGTGPYKYSWSPGGQTTATASGLSMGTYLVNITDASGCKGSAQVTITQPNPLSVKASYTVDCISSTSSATASASGGAGPYTYSWSPTRQTTAKVSGLSGGSYSVIATDTNGCVGNVTIYIQKEVL